MLLLLLLIEIGGDGVAWKSPNIVFRLLANALCRLSGGKLKAGNENPAAAAACNECNNAAECSWALRRNSATDVVRGSFVDDDDDGEPEAVINGGDKFEEMPDDEVVRFADNEEIDATADADDVIVGQQEHKPGKAEAKYWKIVLVELVSKHLLRQKQ